VGFGSGGPVGSLIGIGLGAAQLGFNFYVIRNDAQTAAYNQEADLQQAIYLYNVAQAAIDRLQKQQGSNCP